MLRARSGARYFLIAAFCAAAATACGSAAAPSGAATSSATPKVSLDIKVTGKPGAPATHWTLQCDPAGGTHPDPAAACATLLKTNNPFAPAQKGVDCPMIMVGSKTATVKGTYFGKHVDRTFVDGGCDLPSWAKLGQVFN
jgi:Subtilisin inhibitor-like